jgi:hypothetical protein
VPLDDSVLGPVVIGGVGGSGTRVVEEITRRLRIYTGSDLNSAGDNRWFTFLCKLPRWDLDAATPDSPVLGALTTLERAMTGRVQLDDQDRRIIGDSFRRSRQWWRHDRLPDDRPPRWLRARVASLLGSGRNAPANPPLWGWKEPNSHLFIRHLHTHFGERLRYVHVIRNGLDMAQSRNQLQLSRWGSRFGVANSSSGRNPSASLDYWIRANEAAIQEGRALRPDRFFLLNYDDLCANPEPEVMRFTEFLGLRPPESVLRGLLAVPRASAARSRASCDVQKTFGNDRLTRVRALGFPVGSSE